MARIYPGIHHAVCFRHLMVNFNKKFRDKKLKGMAWAIARATSQEDFEKAQRKLKMKMHLIGYVKLDLKDFLYWLPK